MKIRNMMLTLTVLAGFTASGQMLDPAKMIQKPVDTWPTYNGDYSGQRFSQLKQINSGNVACRSPG
jgi:alcohol dehydrogenase (cytochrome c)